MIKKVLISFCLIFAMVTVGVEKDLKTLVIFDFTDNQGLFAEKPTILTLLIFSKITEKTNEIQILDRQLLETLEDEQITTARNSAKSISEKKYAGAQFLLEGKIYTLGERITVNAKLINTQTGKINGISKSYSQNLPIDDILEQFSDSASNYIIKKLAPAQKKNKKAKK